MFHLSLFVLVLFSSSLSRASTCSPLSTCSLSCTSTSTMSNPQRIRPSAHPHNEEHCSMAMHNPLTGFCVVLFLECVVLFLFGERGGCGLVLFWEIVWSCTFLTCVCGFVLLGGRRCVVLSFAWWRCSLVLFLVCVWFCLYLWGRRDCLFCLSVGRGGKEGVFLSFYLGGRVVQPFSGREEGLFCLFLGEVVLSFGWEEGGGGVVFSWF